MTVFDVAEPVQRLAMVLSLAARIEPELLRAARLRLLPDLDVSAEADLWFSELVESRSTKRMVLREDVSAALRTKLANDPALLHAARAVIADTHRNAPPAIQLEEEITYLGLTGGDVAEAINTKLTAVLNAIANEGRTGLVDWAARALPRMPDVVQNTTAAAALRLVTGGEIGDAMFVRRDVIDDPALAALVEKALPRTVVYARLVSDDEAGLSVEISRTGMPGSHAIELPKTEPLILELTTANQSEIVEVPRERPLMRTIRRSVSIRTIARDVFELSEEEAQERDSVRILLARSEAVHRPADVILIVGDVTRPFPEAFGNARMVAAPGPGWDCAKTLIVANWRIGVVALNTAMGFHPSQLAAVCDGDPLAWRNAHHLAVLLMQDPPESLDGESRHRWVVYGCEKVFDLVACENAVVSDFDTRTLAPVFGVPESGYREIEVRRDRDRIRISVGESDLTYPAREPVILAPEKTPSRRVLVAGTADQLPVRTEEMSRAIGALLALRGHDLLTGGWSGVDYLTAEGFQTAAPARVESIRHYRGQQSVTESDDVSVARSLRDADVVILIDGASGTLAVGQAALRTGRPLIAIGADAAASLRAESLRVWPPEAHERLLRLGDLSIAATVSIVRELLGKVPQSEEGTGGGEEREKSVLLSYSTEDEDLLDEFRKVVGPLLEGTGIVLTNVNTGIDTLPVMISFISPRYMAPRFSRSTEIAAPPGTRWFLFVMSEADYRDTPAAAAEPAHDVSMPLDRVAPTPRYAIFRRMAADLVEILADSQDARDRAVEVYESLLGDLSELPGEWGMTQVRLGQAYARRATSRTSDRDSSDSLHKAIAAFEAALRVMEPPRESAPVLRSLGAAHLQLGQPEQALGALQEAMRHFQALGIPAEVAITDVLLAQLFDTLGRYEEARAHLQSALATFEKLGLEREARIVRERLNRERPS